MPARRLEYTAVLRADFFDISISDLEGNVVDTSLTVEWLFSRHVGIALGTASTRIDIQDTGDDPYKVEWDQSSFLAYLPFSFIEPS